MKARDLAHVVYLLESRKRRLLLIEAKVQDDSELRALVVRCAKCDYELDRRVRGKWGVVGG